MSNIKAVKLVSGEELVVEITNEDETSVTFKNPVAVVLQRRQDGPALGFVPWMQAGDGPFTVTDLPRIVRRSVRRFFLLFGMIVPK